VTAKLQSQLKKARNHQRQNSTQSTHEPVELVAQFVPETTDLTVNFGVQVRPNLSEARAYLLFKRGQMTRNGAKTPVDLFAGALKTGSSKFPRLSGHL